MAICNAKITQIALVNACTVWIHVPNSLFYHSNHPDCLCSWFWDSTNALFKMIETSVMP